MPRSGGRPIQEMRAVGDVPAGDVHVLDAGHFAFDTAADEIAALVRNLLRAPLFGAREAM